MPDFYCNEILTGKVQVNRVYESKNVVAFDHTNPYFEKHVVVIPKSHIESLTEKNAISRELAFEFVSAIQHVAAEIERDFGGCRVSSNIGNYQSTKHLHWYIHAGKRLRDENGRFIESDN